jgi:hypothetical protein
MVRGVCTEVRQGHRRTDQAENQRQAQRNESNRGDQLSVAFSTRSKTKNCAWPAGARLALASCMVAEISAINDHSHAEVNAVWTDLWSESS